MVVAAAEQAEGSGRHEQGPQQLLRAQSTMPAVELSYCADRCWIDCGEASPVRELELQPLLDASGVIAAQHRTSHSEGACNSPVLSKLLAHSLLVWPSRRESSL